MSVWIYTFEDGTQLKLINVGGLSTGEIWKLQELHGSCVISHERM